MVSKEPENPLLAEWTGPGGGVPPFDRVRVEHFQPALEAAMAEKLAEVERIAGAASAATFENTLAALEGSGRAFDRVSAVYGVWSSAMSSPEFQAVEREMAPKLAAFSDRIVQNEALFRRIEAVYLTREEAGLEDEAQRLAWHYYTRFVRAGAKLADEAKARLTELNQRLAALYARFGQNVLADEAEACLVLRAEAELAGLPGSLREAAAAEAAARGLSGAWVIANTRSAIVPFLTFADRRDLRERAWRLFTDRGEGAGERDNYAVVTEILRLRKERATLLGYPTHAHWRLEDAMAGTPERALELLEAVWPPAVARVSEEVAELAALARGEGEELTIEPWDYRYYSERVRARKYDLDQDELKNYLQLDQLRDGMFWAAGELFGLRFLPAPEVPVYHPDVRVWGVNHEASGRWLGFWYFDPYARSGKRSGAWMSAHRRQERFRGEVAALVSNTSNFLKGRGEAVLVSWDDAETLFHEFGHALHGLLSDVAYPSLSGTAVPRDYVEFPSQLFEHWLWTREVLERFARHHRTGERLPDELRERLERAATFQQGFETTEYLASAFVDLRFHLAESPPSDPKAFEAEVLASLGMPRELAMRHRTPHFAHVFSSDGYSAAYYSYLWSEVHAADAAEAFREAGGFFQRTVAERLRRYVLGVGNVLDPAQGYRSFRGRDARSDALMRERGFATEAERAVPRPSTGGSSRE